jgi:hypothetical protein
MPITSQDVDDYGSAFIDFTRRAAVDAVRPELQRLHAENAELRQMAQQSQTANIQAALDRDLPQWRQVYSNPEFSDWLQSPDPYAGESRSQLLRRAVAAGDSNRVVRFYQGFLAEHGHASAAQRSHQSRSPVTSGKRIYSRPEISSLYKRRRDGLIDDRSWAQIEADIFAASRQGRVIGALSLVDGTEMTRLAR